MERRVQSLVDVLSAVYHFLQEQKTANAVVLPEPTTPSSSTRRGGRKGKKGGGGNASSSGGTSGLVGVGSGGNLTAKIDAMEVSSEAGEAIAGGMELGAAATMGLGSTTAAAATAAALENGNAVNGGEDVDGASSRGAAEAVVLSNGKLEAGSGGVAGLFAALAEKPPLKLLADADVADALWSGKQSMMRRLVRKLEAVYSEKNVVEIRRRDEGREGRGAGAEQVSWVYFWCRSLFG